MSPIFPPFDCPAILSRNLTNIASVASLWCALPPTLNPGTSPIKTHIICPQDFLPKDKELNWELFNPFVRDMIRWTDATAVNLSIRAMWSRSPPKDCAGESLEAYLKDVIVQTLYYASYLKHTFYHNKYKDQYGKEPEIHSVLRWQLDLGKSVTPEQNRRAVDRLLVFRSWFLSQFMRPRNQRVVIMVIPVSEGVPNYRGCPPRPYKVPSGFDPFSLSSMLGCPDLVIPIGESPFESRFTDGEEHLPFCVSLLGRLDEDQNLIRVAEHVLRASGRPREVRVGSRMF